MNKITIASSTNSSCDVPYGAEVDTKELQALIIQYLPITNSAQEILSIDISTLPECLLVDENGNDWESNEECRWEQVLTKISKRGVSLIFVHRNTGDELFFEHRIN